MKDAGYTVFWIAYLSTKFPDFIFFCFATWFMGQKSVRGISINVR
jgi:hypothetical protein